MNVARRVTGGGGLTREAANAGGIDLLDEPVGVIHARAAALCVVGPMPSGICHENLRICDGTTRGGLQVTVDGGVSQPSCNQAVQLLGEP